MVKQRQGSGSKIMATVATDIDGETQRMIEVLAVQKASFTAAMPESLAVRTDRIDRAVAMLVDNAEEFAKAVSEDFGHRSREQTLMTAIMRWDRERKSVG